MIFSPPTHQYIERYSQRIITEKLIGDRSISFLYNTVRESAPALFKAMCSGRMSSLLSFYHYDFLDRQRKGGRDIFDKLNIDWQECTEGLDYYSTPRRIFERQIRYWHTRPMTRNIEAIVSPADSRILIGSFSDTSNLFIKQKFFDLHELLGNKPCWDKPFHDGDFAVFRLTPEKYHYNHFPVDGQVVDIYTVDGEYHSCNPTALVSLPSLYAKNKRVVTIIDTDVEGGTGAGLVAMVEVVALMIGDIVQAYSEHQYDNPTPVRHGLQVRKGFPKSLYRPGSSTDVLIFQRGKVSFAEDLVRHQSRVDVKSRFTNNFGRPLVETDILVRSTIGYRR